MWVVKHATSLFNSFCSNVANQVALLLLPVLPHLLDDVPVRANPNTQNEMKTEVFMNPEKKLLIV